MIVNQFFKKIVVILILLTWSATLIQVQAEVPEYYTANIGAEEETATCSCGCCETGACCGCSSSADPNEDCEDDTCSVQTTVSGVYLPTESINLVPNDNTNSLTIDSPDDPSQEVIALLERPPRPSVLI
ncbi:hypothetical protein CEE37_06870 [candidate division LCP-89 bacterium B3_LCP]|uniref:Uncharacterized protein n=1 Tax=candidate division LCP-89 bacterium B3_LCP TaxID=2012998 RepID=A0A532V0L1_UNCL8|nr:MAG: hypothetical protein CEE37_06870 [candidate division LCP-89 bacterium B3_LCP]